MPRRLEAPPYLLISDHGSIRPFVAPITTLTYAALVMKLSVHDVRAALDEHGRCDTDTHILIPREPA